MRSLSRYFLRIVAAALGLGLGLTLVNARADDRDAEAPQSGAKGDNGDDPFPIRRVLLPKDRIAAELERARQGALVRLQRSDFERRVRRAADAARAPVEVPRLVDVRYRAKLLGEGLDENSLT